MSKGKEEEGLSGFEEAILQQVTRMASTQERMAGTQELILKTLERAEQKRFADQQERLLVKAASVCLQNNVGQIIKLVESGVNVRRAFGRTKPNAYTESIKDYLALAIAIQDSPQEGLVKTLEGSVFLQKRCRSEWVTISAVKLALKLGADPEGKMPSGEQFLDFISGKFHELGKSDGGSDKKDAQDIARSVTSLLETAIKKKQQLGKQAKSSGAAWGDFKADWSDDETPSPAKTEKKDGSSDNEWRGKEDLRRRERAATRENTV